MPPTLVLIHALTQDAQAWDMIGRDGACTPVLPGHGTRPRQPMTLAGIADEIAAATDGPLDLVGVAVGGIVAQHLMVRHGGRVRSALLACTTGSTRAAGESMRARAAGPVPPPAPAAHPAGFPHAASRAAGPVRKSDRRSSRVGRRGGGGVIRVAFIGISHWHLPIYLEPVRRLPGVTVAGVSDRTRG